MYEEEDTLSSTIKNSLNYFFHTNNINQNSYYCLSNKNDDDEIFKNINLFPEYQEPDFNSSKFFENEIKLDLNNNEEVNNNINNIKIQDKKNKNEKINFIIFNEASSDFKKKIENKKNNKQNFICEKYEESNLFIFEYRTDIDTITIKNKLKRKKKERKERKGKADEIRKKIKARFLKSLKNNINIKLKKAGSEKLLDFLPQNFVSNISRDLNREVMKLTFRELLEKDFHSNISEPKIKKRNKEKYIENIKVLKYLDKYEEITKNSQFDIISNMKYKDILKEYFNSKEFEESIIKLRDEDKESEIYINDYITYGINYINFFMDHKKDMNSDY